MSKDFLGTGWKFPLKIDPKTGRFAMSSHEENIVESIEIIIRTYLGERVMRPDFGSNTANYVFAIEKDFPAQSIAYELTQTLTLQEPRIRDVEVRTNGPDKTDGDLLINVEYVVRSTNNRYNHVYPFFTKYGTSEV